MASSSRGSPVALSSSSPSSRAKGIPRQHHRVCRAGASAGGSSAPSGRKQRISGLLSSASASSASSRLAMPGKSISWRRAYTAFTRISRARRACGSSAARAWQLSRWPRRKSSRKRRRGATSRASGSYRALPSVSTRRMSSRSCAARRARSVAGSRPQGSRKPPCAASYQRTGSGSSPVRSPGSAAGVISVYRESSPRGCFSSSPGARRANRRRPSSRRWALRALRTEQVKASCAFEKSSRDSSGQESFFSQPSHSSSRASTPRQAPRAETSASGGRRSSRRVICSTARASGMAKAASPAPRVSRCREKSSSQRRGWAPPSVRMPVWVCSPGSKPSACRGRKVR